MDIHEWKKQNGKAKYYAHFDRKIGLNNCWNYVTDKAKVSQHGFYPFIHYTKKIEKYNKKSGIKLKEREICYSAHLDRCIYQYYGFLLNEKYNERLRIDGLSDSVIAYRTDLKKSNVDFAKDAFDFIRKENTFVIVGDFSKFFDMLNHIYLKHMICNLLDVEKLEDDYYQVFKNITKYTRIELNALLELNGLADNEQSIHELNRKETVLALDKFKANKHLIIKNKNDYGIPQGSAISAVLSNIYMLEFDKKVNALTIQYNGKYMRYSDDFIIAIPTDDKELIRELYCKISEIINDTPNLTIQPDKTQIYYYNMHQIIGQTDIAIGINTQSNMLDYLGFTFDGEKVRLRDKTISKYYSRTYRKVKTIVKANFISKNNNVISCKKLYNSYSIKGARINRGNFLTYINRCENIFGKQEEVNRIKKVHMYKIRKKLKK